MASRGQSLTVTYVAWDTSANAGKTGDAGNHTLRWVKDGTSAAPTNAPSEVDATNAPGVYKIALSAAECTADVGVLCGKSSTAGVSIIPLTVTFERLPTAAPGANGGLPTVNASGNVAVNAEAIADAVLSRDVAGVEDAAATHSLCFVVLAMSRSDTTAHPAQWTIYKTTGAEFARKNLTASAEAEAITGVG